MYSVFFRLFMNSLVPLDKWFGNYYYYSLADDVNCGTTSPVIVFEDPIAISNSQLKTLRSVRPGNSFETQSIGNRTLYYRAVVRRSLVEVVVNAFGVAVISSGFIFFGNILNDPLSTFIIALRAIASTAITMAFALAGSSFAPAFSGLNTDVLPACLASECRVRIDDERTKCCRRIRRGRRLVCPRTC